MLYKRIICASPLPCARGAREDSARWPRNRLVEQKTEKLDFRSVWKNCTEWTKNCFKKTCFDMFCKKKRGKRCRHRCFCCPLFKHILNDFEHGRGGDTESSGLPHMLDGTWAGWGDFNVPWRTCSHGQPRKTWGWTFLELAHMVGAFWKVRGWGARAFLELVQMADVGMILTFIELADMCHATEDRELQGLS